MRRFETAQVRSVVKMHVNCVIERMYCTLLAIVVNRDLQHAVFGVSSGAFANPSSGLRCAPTRPPLGPEELGEFLHLHIQDAPGRSALIPAAPSCLFDAVPVQTWFGCHLTLRLRPISSRRWRRKNGPLWRWTGPSKGKRFPAWQRGQGRA